MSFITSLNLSQLILSAPQIPLNNLSLCATLFLILIFVFYQILQRIQFKFNIYLWTEIGLGMPTLTLQEITYKLPRNGNEKGKIYDVFVLLVTVLVVVYTENTHTNVIIHYFCYLFISISNVVCYIKLFRSFTLYPSVSSQSICVYKICL